MLHTTSEENYIKAIYHLQNVHGKVSTTLLSEAMQIKPASVTDMLKKLQAKKMVNYQRYQAFVLTDGGGKIALDIIRKHRLWEFFLVDKLGFAWDKVHALAEELEHVKSRELIVRLDNYLGNPSFDPHGDPIPDHKGKIKLVRQSNLYEMPLKKLLTVSAVKNQSIQMMDMLKHYHISIGSKIKVNRRFDFDNSVEIKVDKQPASVISNLIAINVFCNV
ncbi:MAG: metal-dependent transcriptional regulator [Ferruginibacter sp.]